MSQKSRPRTDVSTGGWTPLPISDQLNEETPDDGSKVISSLSPSDDFTVRIAKLAWPKRGAQTLSVRLRKTSSSQAYAGIFLLQGDVFVTGRIVTPTEAFATYALNLTEAESNRITDYTNLSLRVTANIMTTPGCGQCGSIAAEQFALTLAGVTPNTCVNCAQYNRSYQLTYISGCLWRSNIVEVLCGTTTVTFWELSHQGTGVWELMIRNAATFPPLALYRVSAPSWDCISNLTLNLVSFHEFCISWPSSMTIYPI